MFLPNDIADLILEYLPDYELLEWIDATRLSWLNLSANPNAIHILEQNKDKIDWYCLSKNSAAIHVLGKNKGKIYWDCLSQNPSAIDLLRKKQR